MPYNLPAFTDIDSLKTFIADKGKGSLQIDYRNMPEYSGMVENIGMIFDTGKSTYDLDTEWSSLGLDFWGDTLMENHTYRFQSLEAMLEYLKLRYNLDVTDIPVSFKFDHTRHPNFLDKSPERDKYEPDFKRFQKDYNSGKFLDPKIKPHYSTNHFPDTE